VAKRDRVQLAGSVVTVERTGRRSRGVVAGVVLNDINKPAAQVVVVDWSAQGDSPERPGSATIRVTNLGTLTAQVCFAHWTTVDGIDLGSSSEFGLAPQSAGRAQPVHLRSAGHDDLCPMWRNALCGCSRCYCPSTGPIGGEHSGTSRTTAFVLSALNTPSGHETVPRLPYRPPEHRPDANTTRPRRFVDTHGVNRT
jgi:hypothetical protein